MKVFRGTRTDGRNANGGFIVKVVDTDRGMCDTKKGFAQIDTSQDAHYYGQWVNPFEYKIVAYVEGDVILTECDTEKEFISQLRQIEKWNTPS